MQLNVTGNRAQLPGLLFEPLNEVSVAGRGTGKSFAIGYLMDYIIRRMPRSVTAITGITYGQLLTRTLPSSFKLLNQIGYQQGANYVIGRRPPAIFKDSYEALNKFDNIISFSNGTRFALISQSEGGSGRGANTDFLILDEALTIDQEQYNNEVVPTNRGNNEFFGPKSPNPCPRHHGFSYYTSMPTGKEGHAPRMAEPSTRLSKPATSSAPAGTRLLASATKSVPSSPRTTSSSPSPTPSTTSTCSVSPTSSTLRTRCRTSSSSSR